MIIIIIILCLIIITHVEFAVIKGSPSVNGFSRKTSLTTLDALRLEYRVIIVSTMALSAYLSPLDKIMQLPGDVMTTTIFRSSLSPLLALGVGSAIALK